MNEAIEFLKRQKDVAFATVGADKKPKLRVFEIMRIDERINSIFFATSSDKEVYKQVQSNPNIELLAMQGNISVRVTGKVSFDVTTTTARSIYDESPILNRLYTDYRKLEYFRVLIDSIEYYDLSTDPPKQENYLLA